jgi:hypothetical protein
MNYTELMAHLGHQIELANYANENVAIECLECSEVLLDYDKELDNA